MNGTTVLVAIGVESAAAVACLHAGWATLSPTTPVTFAGSALAGAALFYALYGYRAPEASRKHKPAALACFALSLAAASFSEEVLWRGTAFGALARTTGAAPALCITTLGFAVSHAAGQGWPGARLHLLTGALFGVALLATGHLVDAIAAHAAYNFSLFASVRNKGGSSDELAITT